jgi:sulfur-carrier protein
MVEVHLFAAARAAVGSPLLSVAPGSLAEILDGIAREHPAFASVRVRCSYLVDGVAVHGEDARVGPESRVDVLPPFAGG